MTRNVPNRLNDGSGVESTDSNARQEWSKEEEVPWANNNLTISNEDVNIIDDKDVQRCSQLYPTF